MPTNNETDVMITLARRAVACDAWRWMPGMREEHGATCCKVLDGEPWLWFVDDCVTEHEGEECFPDLNDPATLGCLLSLVRGAWDDPFAAASADGSARWRMLGSKDYRGLYDFSGLGEAEALVAALEAAP